MSAQSPCRPKPDPDKVERERLQLEIDQLGQAQKEISEQIETLAKKGLALEQKEREARKRLRELFTERLELK